MKFKELEVFGFKSFADKLKVKFGTGITAIVGPNGCGKSNVADAIRWVLGEQSARLLRGKSMADVIFSGTQARKNLSYCEVLLRFDNQKNAQGLRMFPSYEYSEVTVSRKLYRSGESLYFINNAECRLKDVVSLLRDGGMGREGYSIIGQGRIDEILSAKPENRRAIFEEAAGIAGHKQKKLENERKLARTRENLTIINIEIDSKQRVLGPLTAAAEKARKCLELRDKLKEHQVNIYIHQRDTADKVKEELSGRLDTAAEELSYKEKELEDILSDYHHTKERYQNIDADQTALHERLTILNVDLQKQEGEIENLKQRLDFLGQNINRIEEEGEVFEAAISRLGGLISLSQRDKGDIEAQLAVLNDEQAAVLAEYTLAKDNLNLYAGRRESEREAEIAAADKLLEIKSNLSGLNTEKKLLKESVIGHEKEIKSLLSEAKALELKQKEASDSVEELLTRKKADQSKLSDLENEISILNENLKKAIESLNDLSGRLSAAVSKHELLKDIKEKHEGYGFGVKNLLDSAKKDKRVSDKIEGVVAQLISVEKHLETAVETALGGAFQNVVVRTEEDANYLISHLKTNRLGRVTLMPVSSAKPRRLDKTFEPLLNTKGCLGVASDLIKYNPKYKSVMEGFLGAVIIVDTAATALEIAKKSRFGFKIVTLEGDIFAVSGSITGGSFNNKAGRDGSIFSREREIIELTDSISQLKKDIEKSKSDRLAAEKAIEKLGQTEKILSQNIHQLALNIAAQMETLNAYSSERESLSLRLSETNNELNAANARIATIDKDLDSVVELEEFLAKARQTAVRGSRAEAEGYEKARIRLDELNLRLGDIKVEISKKEGLLSRALADLERMGQEIDDCKNKIIHNVSSKQKTADDIARTTETIIEITKRAQSDDTQAIKRLKEEIADSDTTKRRLSEKIDTLDRGREELSVVIQALRDRRTELEFQLNNVDGEIEALSQRLMEDYSLDYEGCLQFKFDDYDMNTGLIEAGKLKKAIFSLGDVNIGAIEQSKEMFGEYHKLLSGRDDIIKAENDLVRIIKELSKDMLKQFNENFEKIRVNFVKAFKELFDGGIADIYITEPEEDDDPLTAGIEIVAQPPQKKLQSISLLSGGERALTAIAILFAILRLKPMPFCVLDEIEAALDDANAGRFAKYLRRFSAETQFIVITHRKPTMELADSLYGVTMEEKGVSKIVSVKLSDAMSFSEQKTA